MVRLLQDLNLEIANVVELQHYMELKDIVQMSMKIERQLKRKKGSTKHGKNSSSSTRKSS